MEGTVTEQWPGRSPEQKWEENLRGGLRLEVGQMRTVIPGEKCVVAKAGWGLRQC